MHACVETSISRSQAIQLYPSLTGEVETRWVWNESMYGGWFGQSSLHLASVLFHYGQDICCVHVPD